jgi:hypothetical protein
MRITFLAALAIFIAGCGSSGQTVQNQPISAKAGNVIEQVDALSDRQHDGVFVRAIRPEPRRGPVDLQQGGWQRPMNATTAAARWRFRKIPDSGPDRRL